jgi:CreA protein
MITPPFRSRRVLTGILWLVAGAMSPIAHAADPQQTRIGDVSTTFRVLGRNDKIVVDRYDDPAVNNVSCYVSRAETGGIAGSFGLATDPSRFSIACRSTGPASLRGSVPDNEVVFGTSANWAFKEIRVSRIVDRQRNVLVYLVWSTQALSKGGSPYNSVSAVPLDAH